MTKSIQRSGLLFVVAATSLLPIALQAQSVTVTPSANVYVGVGLTQKFHAAVTGLTNTSVTWSLIGMGPVNNPLLGSVSSTGLYTAPTTIPAQNPVTLRATASDGKTVGSTYVLIEPLGPTLTAVLPNPIAIDLSQSTAYRATVTGTGFQTGVRVLAGPNEVEVSSFSPTQLVVSGYYAALGPLTFTATNPGSTLSNAVTATFVAATAGGPIKVLPSSVVVAPSATIQFTSTGQPTVTNNFQPTITWATSAGTITANGLFTAPTTVPSSGMVTITASGKNNQKATATVTFNGVPLTVAAPTFDPPAGTYTSAQAVKLSSATSGATIRYTTDGTNPSETAGTVYSAGFSVGTTTTVKAIAFKTGSTDSAISSATYTINIPTVAAPTFNPPAGTYTSAQTVTLNTTTSGATIRYTTDGTNPSETAGTVYSAGFSVGSTTTVKAIAFKTGSTDSTISSATYTINIPATVVAPTFNPPAGTYTSAQTVTLSTTTSGATIRYTTDGTNPSEAAGTVYSAGFSVGSTTTVKAIAFKTGSTDSAISSATYTINLPAVTISVNPTTASLSSNQTQPITPTVTNSSNLGVNWSLSGAGGISAATSTSGMPITYTAPATIAATTTVTVTATSAADSTKTATTTITLNPAVGGPITVSPAAVTLALGGTQTFMASGQPSITWSASAGTITQGGAFTAPSAMTSTGTVIITATGTSNQSGTATVTLTGGTNQVTAAAAARFLQQAAFGPSPSDVASVQALGFQGWLNQQFATPKISNYQSTVNGQGGFAGAFLANAVTNSDQLRQRVAFALSQIAVVSISTLNFNGDLVPHEEMLLNDAFTNYRQIMGDVTLSAPMGDYLNMANNAAANAATGTVANENYARELMQLFSLGTALLNQDGSRQTDSSGDPIATYNQTNVTELARVLTGWTYSQTNGTPVEWGSGIDGSADPTKQMVAVTAFHDFGSKTLLPDFLNGNGTTPYVAPANLSPQVDLSQALDNVFYHPNVGPFIGKELIKFLVKSNPTPAYVSRVSAAFANNGQGVRGDMRAVISAILLDPEARENDTGDVTGNTDFPTAGHLQEPALYVAGVFRALNGSVASTNYFPYDLSNLSQDIFNPASVFNYYSPGYTLPQTKLQGGEFQIYNTYTSLYRANMMASLFGNYSDPVMSYGPSGTTIDLTSYVNMINSQGAAAVLNALDVALTRGVMPSTMKSTILTAVQGLSGSPLAQVESAIYLIVTSNYYNVWH